MATYNEIVKLTNAMAARISDYAGVPKPLVMNIIQYSKCLPSPSQPDVVEYKVFIGQMGTRFGITSMFFMGLMYEAIQQEGTSNITVEDFARMISIFVTPDLDVKIDFVFSVYNFTKTGYIRPVDIGRLLKNTIVPFGEEEPHDQLKELVDMIMRLVDTNHDGMLSLEEFRQFVKRDSVYLELFGKVLPEDRVLKSFLTIMDKHSVYEIRDYFANERAECVGDPLLHSRRDNPLYPGVILDIV